MPRPAAANVASPIRPLVTRALGSQIARYVFGPRAEASRRLGEDPAVAKAVALLHGVRSPRALIERVRGR